MQGTLYSPFIHSLCWMLNCSRGCPHISVNLMFICFLNKKFCGSKMILETWKYCFCYFLMCIVQIRYSSVIRPRKKEEKKRETLFYGQTDLPSWVGRSGLFFFFNIFVLVAKTTPLKTQNFPKNSDVLFCLFVFFEILKKYSQLFSKIFSQIFFNFG